MMEAAEEYRGGSCCFCFSTNKKSARNYSKRNGSFAPASSEQAAEWGKNDGILSDMSTFSVREQERRLKKALEEEHKVSKEAERVVQWVKQESAKIDVSTVNRVLSSHEYDGQQKGNEFL